MTIQSAFEELCDQLETLKAGLNHLEWAIEQARPRGKDMQGLASQLSDALQELSGQVHGASEHALQGQSKVVGQINLGSARQALIVCNDEYNQALKVFYNELRSPEVMESLSWLSREGKSDWGAWVSGVEDAISTCERVLVTGENYNMFEALLGCWKELSDRAGLVSVSVNANPESQIQMVMDRAGDEKSTT